jgi:hypothetical protein
MKGFQVNGVVRIGVKRGIDVIGKTAAKQENPKSHGSQVKADDDAGKQSQISSLQKLWFKTSFDSTKEGTNFNEYECF